MRRDILEGRVGILLLVLVLVFTVVCLRIHSQKEAEIVESFKELDQQDLKIQSTWNKHQDYEKNIGEIYCEPQLSKAIAYFKELKEKGLILKLKSVDYKSVEVLEYNGDSAVLLVESRYDGDYVKESSGESLRKIGIDLLCQVELSKSGEKWKIQDIVTLKNDAFGT